MAEKQPQDSPPLVSVLIPARNAENTLGETLSSLLAQSYTDFAVVLVDDASTDRTRQIAMHYADLFPKGCLQVIDGPAQGIPAVRNKGLHHIESQFIANLDADDLCEPDRLAHQVKTLLNNPKYVAVGSPVSVIDESGKKINELGCPESPADVRAMLFQKCCLYHSSMMFRRSALLKVGGYRQKFPVAEDYDLYLRLLAHGEIGTLTDTLVRYRRHATQTTNALSNTHRLTADMVLLSAVARLHEEEEPDFSNETLAADVGVALRTELREHGLSHISPKVARHMTRRVKKAKARPGYLKGLLFAENAKARNYKEAAKALLI